MGCRKLGYAVWCTFKKLIGGKRVKTIIFKTELGVGLGYGRRLRFEISTAVVILSIILSQ